MRNTTIAAISTPIGSGGIGVVRLSGPEAVSISEQLFRSNSGKLLRDCKGYTGLLGRIFDDQGDLDDAIAFLYRAPRSYTGEDVVELSCHGGIYLVRRLLRLCLDAGALPAGPGEFTKRAYLNGKMALSEAEAVMDLVAARGDSAARAALSARDGALSGAVGEIAERLLVQSAHLAAWADYPDEEIEEVNEATLRNELESAHGAAERLLSTWDRGRMIREGVATAIVGRPNVGKSTLMNLLAGEDRSIVTDIPGTTRDVVEDEVRLGEVVLRLADTAGLRETENPVERIGVEKARDRLETAELVLAVFDSADSLTQEDRDFLSLLKNRPCIAVVNKIDLPRRLDLEAIREAVPRLVEVSAQTGAGRDALEAEVAALFGLELFDSSAPAVFSERQRQCLREAAMSLDEALDLLRSGMTLDAVNVSVDYALDALLSLTGQRASDAVVDQVFARFCVGK